MSSQRTPKIPALRADDDDERVHERVGGYWVTGLGAEARISLVRRALNFGRTVWLVGFARRKVVRILEVHPQGNRNTPDTFRHWDGERWVTFERDTSDEAITAATAHGRRRFAEVYRGEQRRRVRYFTRCIDDTLWRGADIALPGGGGWHNPGAYQLAPDSEAAMSPEASNQRVERDE